MPFLEAVKDQQVKGVTEYRSTVTLGVFKCLATKVQNIICIRTYTLLYIEYTTYITTHPLMDIYVASTSWLH